MRRLLLLRVDQWAIQVVVQELCIEVLMSLGKSLFRSDL